MSRGCHASPSETSEVYETSEVWAVWRPEP
jgi:hypothetical protein